MEKFATTDSGYRALQLVIQDVWEALDENVLGKDAIRQTRWRTVDIDVPSWSGWDIATSLDLPTGEAE